MPFKNIEPIFVIIDDFSAYGENFMTDYAEGSVIVPTGGSANVCLFDYGFVDFQSPGGSLSTDMQPDFVNLTFPKADILSNYADVVGNPLDEFALVDSSAGIFNGTSYNKDGSFVEAGNIETMSDIHKWQFTPTKYDNGAWQQADDVMVSEPAHGDFVFSQFVDQLSTDVIESSHIFLIDVDFGDDLTALTASDSSVVIGDMYDSFIEGKYGPDGQDEYDALHPLFGMTASFGGPKGPGSAGDEIQFFAEQPGAVLQASANAGQGGYNWASDTDYEYVMTIGAWNMGQDGNIAATESYLKSEIDVYADGYVDNLYGYSGFGTSYATPAVAAETLNLLHGAVSGKGFESETEITNFLFDVITPGFQSPELWAEQVADLITTDIKVNLSNGTSEIVQVMTSDLDENLLLEPSQLSGYNGEASYWGKNIEIIGYERVESADDDELDFSGVGPQVASVMMEYFEPDINDSNYKVSIELTFDTPVSVNWDNITFESFEETGGSTGHTLSLEPNQDGGQFSTTFIWSMLTGQDPGTWDSVSKPVFDSGNTTYSLMDQSENSYDIDFTEVFNGVEFISNDVEFTELGSGSDKYYGSDEADYVITGGGADYIALGSGDDIVAVSGAVLSTDVNPFDSKSKFAIIDTGSGDDTVEIATDMEGAIKLVSGGGNDRLVIEGLPGDFSMSAAGNDLVIFGDGQSITLANQMLVGDQDVDVFSYLEYVASDGSSELFILDTEAPVVSGGIVTLVGTNSDDKLELSWNSNQGDLKGLAGDDRLHGGWSDDYLDGGVGDDYLDGDEGEDTLSGGEGEDFLEGGGGSDYLAGGLGDDVYVVELDYSSFFDLAGSDNFDDALDPGDPLYENGWDITIGNVDTINETGGDDRLILLTPPSSEDPFDQYHDSIAIDSEGNLNLNWIVEPKSENAYSWSLDPNYKYVSFNDTASGVFQHGAYIPVKETVKSKTYDDYELMFYDQHSAEAWLANIFGPQLHSGDSGDIYDTNYSKYIKTTNITGNLKAGVGAYGSGKDAMGADIDTSAKVFAYSFDAEALMADGQFITTQFSSLVDLQSAYPETPSANDVFVKDIGMNEYVPATNLDNFQSAGHFLDFDLYKVETWPGFSDLPTATDAANPEVGTQEYWSSNFDLAASPPVVPNIWPAVAEMQWIDLNALSENMGVGPDGDVTIDPGHQGVSWAPISNANAELVQGVNINNFAVKDEHGNWSDTIESIIMLNPEKASSLGNEIIPGILSGSKSAHDSITAQKSTDFIEYFLSPSGVVDQGLFKTPTFNSDGSVKSYTETTKWDGADTQKNFFLVANEDMAGQNTLALGFDGHTGFYTDESDTNPNTAFNFGSDAVLTSGAALHDIIIGSHSDSVSNMMFGHGGDDWIQANTGANILVGGSGSDKFVIENGEQNTIVIGDHAKVVDGDFDTEDMSGDRDYDGINQKFKTVNDSHSDKVFFDFAWPYVDPVTGEKDSDSYIEQLGQNHFKVCHTLENGETMKVELYDVEGAYFSDGNGGLEFHALTTGRPITSADFIDKTPYKDKAVNYEKNEIKFLVEHDDADYSGATTISVVTTATKTITLPDKSKFSYEEPTVHWKGVASEASAFKFADVTVNVINVSDTDLTGAPIVDPLVQGTEGIDLIIGDENDNIIYGGESDDIIFGGDGEDTIFGEGGDDVIIGGDMDDILYGDYEFDSDIPDLTLDDNGNVVELPAHLAEGNDVIVGGAGRDEIISGDGNNVVASGDLSAVILNTELDDDHTFLNYDEDDLIT